MGFSSTKTWKAERNLNQQSKKKSFLQMYLLPKMWNCKNQLPSFLFSITYYIILLPRCRSNTLREMYTSHSSITQVCENFFPSHENLKLYRDFRTALNSHGCNTWLPKTFTSGRWLTVMSIPIDAKISMCDAEGVALKKHAFSGFKIP